MQMLSKLTKLSEEYNVRLSVASISEYWMPTRIQLDCNTIDKPSSM